MDNVSVVLMVFGLLVVMVGIVLYEKNINIVKEWAYEFIVHAEQTIVGTAQGREKMFYVIDRIQELLPWYLKFVFTDTILESIIQQCFDIIKSVFKYGIVKGDR